MKWGWLEIDAPNENSSFMPLWSIIALSQALGRPDVQSNAALRARLLSHLQTSQEILRLYAPQSDPGAWNGFPFQDDPTKHSVYSSTLALMALVQLERSDLPWENSTQRRHELIRQTSQWLISQYQTRASQHGWRNNLLEEHASDIYDGLTAETYCALLEAEQSGAGVMLSAAMHDDIRQYLIGCSNRGVDYSIDVTELYVSYKHIDGGTRFDRGAIRYLWWPWVTRCANDWLRYAEQHQLPMAHRVQVRRALSHFVIDLGPPEAAKVVAGYSYVMSEDLYCLERVGDVGR